MKLKLFIRKVKSFILNIDNKTKLSIVKAIIYSGIARIYIFYLPFNKLRKKMGNVKIESDEIVERDVEIIAKGVTSIVSLVAYKTPWESKCLVQALTAQWMLRDKGISTTLYLGVKKDSNNNMLAHAWTRCGQYYVTGGGNKEGYAIVAKFTSVVAKSNKEEFIEEKKLSRQN